MWKPQGWHVMHSQVSVSYIKYMCPQYCAAMHSDTCVGHVLGVCTTCVRSTLLLVLNPQEDKKENGKRNRLRSFLCGDQGGIPGEQNRELTTT